MGFLPQKMYLPILSQSADALLLAVQGARQQHLVTDREYDKYYSAVFKTLAKEGGVKDVNILKARRKHPNIPERIYV